MSSVTGRINEIKQPYGGYVKSSQFKIHKMDDGCVLSETENIHASIVGMTVDYLTRFLMNSDLESAFRISCMGAEMAEFFGQKNAVKKAAGLLSGIKGVDDASIVNACKLVTYDVWLRNPMLAFASRDADDTNPDMDTIRNIKIMCRRSLKFWKDYGPIVRDGFTFEPNGYTRTVDSGDGDYLTIDTLWDFKVSKARPTSKHRLQLLMYWIMGQHSGQEIYRGIQNIGIFNPRLNEIYLCRMDSISKEIISDVERNVICY